MKTAILLPETAPNNDFDIIKRLPSSNTDSIESALATLDSIAAPTPFWTAPMPRLFSRPLTTSQSLIVTQAGQ